VKASYPKANFYSFKEHRKTFVSIGQSEVGRQLSELAGVDVSGATAAKPEFSKGLVHAGTERVILTYGQYGINARRGENKQKKKRQGQHTWVALATRLKLIS
jgi:hypothetical protein